MQSTENSLKSAEQIDEPKYCLKLRQSPTQGEVTPLGGNDKDKKQLEPAIIVELVKYEEYQENQVYQDFLFATTVLVDADTLTEVTLLESPSTPILTGCKSSSLHFLLDPEKDLSLGIFLVFPDIAVRKEGKYKLKVVLYKIEGGPANPFSTERKVHQITETFTDTFEILPPNLISKKKVPPTALSRSFSQQGVRMKLKRQPRSSWIIENAESSPPPKRRAQDAVMSEEALEKRVRAARISKPKLDEHSDGTESTDTLSISKGSKNRIEDLLNREESSLPSRSESNVSHIRREEMEIQSKPTPQMPLYKESTTVIHTIPEGKRNHLYHNAANTNWESHQGYSNHLVHRDVHYNEYSPRQSLHSLNYQDYYEKRDYLGPHLPPIRSLDQTNYPSESWEYPRHEPNGAHLGSPYWRYWKTLEEAKRCTPDQHYPGPRPNNPY